MLGLVLTQRQSKQQTNTKTKQKGTTKNGRRHLSITLYRFHPIFTIDHCPPHTLTQKLNTIVYLASWLAIKTIPLMLRSHWPLTLLQIFTSAFHNVKHMCAFLFCQVVNVSEFTMRLFKACMPKCSQLDKKNNNAIFTTKCGFCF